ncbi:MAG TPA: amino acid permease [bacterium]|nr:amino acid permease [bacterium]HPN45913.1 amino acid permease [bacterium]
MNDRHNPQDPFLGLLSATNIVIANMIGAGIFTISGLLMQDLINPWAMLALWLAGGLIAWCGALSYGALGMAMPYAGGEYLFLSRLYHPLFGFLSGWVSFLVGFSAPIAASAIGFGEYFYRCFPQLLAVPGISDPILVKKLTSLLLIAVFTIVHIKGLKTGARVQNAITGLKIAFIVLLLLAGFSLGHGNWQHFQAAAPYRFDFNGWKAMGLGLMWIMFAYSGWNAATYIGGEIKNPGKNIPRSLLLGTAAVTLLYCLLNVLYIYAVAPVEMRSVISIGGLAAGRLFGPAMEHFFSLFIAIALLSSLSAFIILGPRVYYAMAKDGLFFKAAGRINEKSGVPVTAILLQALLAMILVLSGTFEQILTYMGFSLGIFPLLTVAGVFRVRKTDKTLRLPGYPLAPVIYLLFGSIILILAFLQRPLESGIALVTVLAGVPFYGIFKKKNLSNNT